MYTCVYLQAEQFVVARVAHGLDDESLSFLARRCCQLLGADCLVLGCHAARQHVLHGAQR